MTREEAIERIRRRINGMSWCIDNEDKDAITTLIPEIAESEDERIIRCLEEIVDWGCSKNIATECDVELKDVKDWLEKQKEQKSLNISAASEWLRKHVHLYMNSEYNEFHKCVEYDGSIDKERLINDFEEAMRKEQKPKFNVGDTIRLKNSYVEYTIESISDGKYYCKGCSIDIDGGNRDYELVRQKSAEWSEEDEDTINLIIDILRENHPDGLFKTNPVNTTCMSAISTDMLIKRIESLRPSWKPSKEQMEALLNILHPDDPYYLDLKDLYEDLKKL